MTPVTPEQATFIAGFLSTSPVASNAIYSLASQIKSAEACHEAREEEAHQLSERIIKLTKERDALMAAAKLAMDALVYDTRDPMSNKDLARVLTAITALRQAGVQ